MKKNLILISGIAASGKDTFYNLSKNHADCERIAFADKLKEELAPKIKDKYNIDIFTCSREQKDSVRQELIDYGRQKRQETDGKYWIDAILTDIKKAKSKFICITDVRFPNEFETLSKKHNAILVHIEKWKDGKFIQPTIPDEIENNPILKGNADYHISWPEVGEKTDILDKYVGEFWKEVFVL